MQNTQAIAIKIIRILDRDKRSAKQFAESILDQQRRRKLINDIKQVLVGKL
jgi:hypothetical protein